MSKIRVLMVDDNVNLIKLVCEYFMGHSQIELVLEAFNGEEGIKIIDERQDDYDLVILDLIMPVKDGIYVLEEMKRRNIDKKVIIATSFNQQDTIRRLSEMGASYFILKPFELIDLEKRIIECFNNETQKGTLVRGVQNDLEIEVTKILHALGLPSHIKGYQYIREGIVRMFSSDEYIGAVTKVLYPEIAKKYKTTVSRVERAIRHAIEVSWNRGDWAVMEEIFGNSVDIERAKPTNSEFVAAIADKLKLDFGVKTTRG